MEFESRFSNEELVAQDEELYRQIFEEKDRITYLGSSVPSNELISQYLAELDDIRAAQAHVPRPDDKLTASSL
jgi:hypothetical protein